jgi:hypothetical protein
MSSPRLWFLLALSLAGCVTADFVSTDPYFRPRSHMLPLVFIDRLPPFPYRSVGIIEATIPENHPLSEVMRVVAAKGQEVGCEAIVDRSIHHVSAAPAFGGQRWLVQYHPPVTSTSNQIYRPAATTPVAAPPAGRREFICAVREEAPPPPVPASGT